MCGNCLACTALFVADVEYCANEKAANAWNRRVSDKEKDPCPAGTEQESSTVTTARND